eukprot:7257582-Pyramimonas_sp.AAC.2
MLRHRRRRQRGGLMEVVVVAVGLARPCPMEQRLRVLLAAWARGGLNLVTAKMAPHACPLPPRHHCEVQPVLIVLAAGLVALEPPS